MRRLGLDQKTIHPHLGKMPILANSLNEFVSAIAEGIFFARQSDWVQAITSTVWKKGKDGWEIIHSHESWVKEPDHDAYVSVMPSQIMRPDMFLLKGGHHQHNF